MLVKYRRRFEAVVAACSVLCFVLLDRIPFHLILFLMLLCFAAGYYFEKKVVNFVTKFFTLLIALFFFIEFSIRLSYYGTSGLNILVTNPRVLVSLDHKRFFDYENFLGIAEGRYCALGGCFNINKDGFRGALPAREKPADVFRVAVVGASVTHGAGINDDGRYSDHLEKRLRELHPIPGKKFEVMNISGIGATIGNRLFFVKNYLMNFSPDLILFEVKKSEFAYRSFMGTGYYKPGFKKSYEIFSEDRRNIFNINYQFFHRYFYIFDTIDKLLSVGIFKSENYLLPAESQERMDLTFTALKSIAGETAAAVLIFKVPDEKDFTEIKPLLADRAAAGGLRLIDLDPDNTMQVKKIIWSDYHPDAETHRLYGERLAEKIVEIYLKK